MPTRAEMEADAALVFRDFPGEPATVAGTACTVLVLSLGQGTDAVFGGLWAEYDGTLSVPRNALPALPREGQKVTLRSKTFTIGQVSVSDDAAPILLALRNASTPR